MRKKVSKIWSAYFHSIYVPRRAGVSKNLVKAYF